MRALNNNTMGNPTLVAHTSHVYKNRHGNNYMLLLSRRLKTTFDAYLINIRSKALKRKKNTMSIECSYANMHDGHNTFFIVTMKRS